MRSHGGGAVHLRGHDALGQGGVRPGQEPHGLRRVQAGRRHLCPHPGHHHGQQVGLGVSDAALLDVFSQFFSQQQVVPLMI